MTVTARPKQSFLMVRLPERDRALIESAAHQAGTSLSNYVRTAALREAGREPAGGEKARAGDSEASATERQG
jgi:hypothetical protein